MTENPKREPTFEEKADYEARRKKSSEYLQAMASSSDDGKVGEYFENYFKLMAIWTDKETAAKGMVVPPWFVPGADIQLIVMHTQLALLTKVCNDAGIFMAAEMARRAKNSSGLVDAGGQQILSGG